VSAALRTIKKNKKISTANGAANTLPTSSFLSLKQSLKLKYFQPCK
jgi:hypothetical protein